MQRVEACRRQQALIKKKTILLNKTFSLQMGTRGAAVKKWDCNFGDFHVFHFNRGITCRPAARETSTAFSLMKPFEIPLDKLENMLGGHA